MDGPPHGRSVLPAVCLLATLLSVAGLAYALYSSRPTRFDDSYMFLRYADNILAGHGHAWNPGGEQVYGSTSLLHVGVVTLVRFCCPLPENVDAADATVLLIASALPGALMLLVLVVTCARCSTHPLLHNRYLLWAGLLLPVLVFDGTVRYHHQTGMDTMLAGLCNALLILFTMRLIARRSGLALTNCGGRDPALSGQALTNCGERDPELSGQALTYGTVRRLVPVVLIGYLTFLARPDNGIYATLFPALCILLLGANPLAKGRRSSLRLLGIFLSSLLAVLLIDGAVKWLVFGNPLPLAFYVKQHGAYQGYANPDGPNPWVHLATFLAVAIPYVCVMGLFAGRSASRTVAVFLLPVGLTFAYYFSVHQIMGGAGRFYFPSLPFFVVPAALAIDGRLRAVGEGEKVLGQRELLLRLAAVALVVFVGRETLAQAAARYQRTLPQPGTAAVGPDYETAAAEPLPPVDRWQSILAVARIAHDAPAGTVIALSEHGLVGASAPQVVLIDLVGLHDKQFALDGFSAAELFRREPDLIWFPHYHYTHHVAGILHSEEFWRRYTFYPGAFDYGLAIRKDSVHFHELSRLVAREWKVMYGDRDPTQYAAEKRGRGAFSRGNEKPPQQP